MTSSENAATKRVPVKLSKRQLEAITAMDTPVSQYIREAVEDRLTAEVPDYREGRRVTGTGWFPPAEEIDPHGDPEK